MIERSADAWEHSQFKETIVRVANVEMSVRGNDDGVGDDVDL